MVMGEGQCVGMGIGKGEGQCVCMGNGNGGGSVYRYGDW